MDLAALRVGTQPEHESVEKHMPLTGEHITREVYAGVLAAMYPVLAGWEQWAKANAPEDLAGMAEDRRRLNLLERDLVALGVRVPRQQRFDGDRIPGALSQDTDQRRAAFLGALYVMEGSTLGGQYIARHVEPRLGLSEENGTAYFRGYGERTGAHWNEVKAVLAAEPEAQSERIIAAAKATFALFEQAVASPG